MNSRDLLRIASRTFAIGIERLPGVLCEATTVAYLLLRVSDYFEDNEEMPSNDKVTLLNLWVNVLREKADIADLTDTLTNADTSNPDAIVAQHSQEILLHLRSLPVQVQEIIVHHVIKSTQGMARWTKQGPKVDDENDLDDYMFEVAGRVGYLVTQLFAWYSLNIRKKEKEIILTDGSGSIEKALGTFEASTSFAWSRDSELVAYIDSDRALTAGTIGAMHVMDLATSEDFFQDKDVMAFFWSPNSKKLAYFKPFIANNASEGGTDTSGQAQQRVLLQLNVLDVISGETHELFTFRPTDQFAAVLPYFDQYHQSTTIWSPDSNNLVLSFLTTENNPGIAIVAASGQLEPRLLAEGYLAFWSWK